MVRQNVLIKLLCCILGASLCGCGNSQMHDVNDQLSAREEILQVEKETVRLDTVPPVIKALVVKYQNPTLIIGLVGEVFVTKKETGERVRASAGESIENGDLVHMAHDASLIIDERGQHKTFVTENNDIWLSFE